MNNIDKFPFNDPPADGATLMDLCCRVFAKNFARYRHDDAFITDLPIEVASRLKSYVTPRMLHEMMPFLDKRGIDASHDWKMLRETEKYACSSDQSLCWYSIDSLRRGEELLDERGCVPDILLPRQSVVKHFHHKYIASHCERLLADLFHKKQGKMPFRRSPGRRINPTGKDVSEVYKELLHFLPLVVSLPIDIDNFRKLNQEPEIFDILIGNLETLVVGCMGSYAARESEQIEQLTVAGAEKIAKILRKFCRSKTLKAVAFDCMQCNDECEWNRENESLILKGLYKNEKDENLSMERLDINLNKMGPDGVTYSDNDFEVVEIASTPWCWDDDKIHKSDETWTDFQENLKAIEQARKRSQTQDVGEKPTENLAALSLCINCFLYVGKYLPHLKTVRRLSFVGSSESNVPQEGLAREILTKIACYKLTHLHLKNIDCDNLVPRIFFIFHEYYRKGTKFEGPMEMLVLERTSGKDDERYPVFDEEVLAVKDFRSSCSEFDAASFSAYLTFLRRNICLTHLKLDFTDSTVVSFVPILESLVDSKVLQSVDLQGYKKKCKDDLNQADSLVRFLNQVTTLRKLKLESCGINGETVRSRDLIEAIQKHQSLRSLCLCRNDIGSAGAYFLAALLKSNGGKPLNLKDLDLSRCEIPGEDLLLFAENLNENPVYMPLIDNLNIGHYVYKAADNKMEVELHEKLKKEYSKLVQYLDAGVVW